MKPSGLCSALTALIFTAFTAACTADRPTAPAPTPPAAEPIADTAPYLCGLIPEQAFRVVSGATGALAEKTVGSQTSGECWAPDTRPRPLEVGWEQATHKASWEHLDFLMDDRRQLYSRHDGVKLPTDLGDGMAAHLMYSPWDDQPYRVSAKFRCGGTDRMIDIFLARVAAGRDAIKDLTALMRIAQKRYAEVYRCTPDGTQAP